METELIELFDQGARFSFRGEAFRTRREIPNDEITDIDFSRIPLNDSQVHLLLPLKALEGISFWNTKITDHAIGTIQQLQHLKRLNLCGTQVTDDSVPILISMNLEFLDVAETEISQEGLKGLREGLPMAEILD